MLRRRAHKQAIRTRTKATSSHVQSSSQDLSVQEERDMLLGLVQSYNEACGLTGVVSIDDVPADQARAY